MNSALLLQSRQSLVDNEALRNITDVYEEYTINSVQTRDAFFAIQISFKCKQTSEPAKDVHENL